MARFALSLLAVLLAASYFAATAQEVTLDDLCKETYDARYCVTLLKPTISRSTNFGSVEWQRRALNRVFARALIAKRFMISVTRLIDRENASSLKSCVHRLHASAKLLKEATLEFGSKDYEKSDMLSKMDVASSNQVACYDLLDDSTGDLTRQVRAQANEAYMANKIVQDILTS